MLLELLLATGLVAASAEGAEAPSGGTFCWDAVPEAVAYRVYSATPSPPGAPWHCHATVEACASTICCAYIVDAPGDLVFYIVTAVAADGRESDGGHGLKEPCP
jgi:hypothetical protein